MTVVNGDASLTVNTGMLDNSAGASRTFTAPVHVPPGQLVCRMMLVARDNDANYNIDARLLRKSLAATSSLGAAPTQMGSVSSTSAADSIRVFTDTTISYRTISASYIYWVELEYTLGFYQTLAIRIEYKTSC